MNILNKLGLGTVQWGLHYGIANENGQAGPETVAAILADARHQEIRVLDTASLYGKAEAVLGKHELGHFRVITKTPKFGTPFITDQQVSQLTNTFCQSLSRLSCTNVYGLLIHHAEDLIVPGGEKLVSAMKVLKDRGVVTKVGISVYDSRQIDAILKIFKPDIVQLPISVLDQRLLLDGSLERLKQKGIEIHVRSVFLQGLLLMPLERVPSYFHPIMPLLTRWHNAVEENGVSLVQAALSFVRDISCVDTVLVGVESINQFQDCCRDFTSIKKIDASGLACHDPAFVNPSLWKLS